MKAITYLIPVLSILLLCAGCGTPGAPMPPSLELPRPPSDLTASRKGDKVTLSWTPPTQTTDGTNVRGKTAGPTRVCRTVAAATSSRCDVVGETAAVLPLATLKGKKQKNPPAPARAQFVDTLPAGLMSEQPTGFALYVVEAMNSHGRSAGDSNQVRVPLAPTAPAPTDLATEVTADAIRVSYCFKRDINVVRLTPRVYRMEKGSSSRPVALSGETSVTSNCAVTLDRNFEWEKTYDYWATVVSEVIQDGRRVAEVEGDDSAPLTVFAHDVFPPAVPQGLQAVASGVGQKPFVDLTWAPDGDADLAGYNVYREDAAGGWLKLNPAPVPTPAFRDENVVSGSRYTYAVSAVDVRGNESERSASTMETAQ